VIRYGAELSAAWEAHLAPRGPGAPTVISTFAGVGGSSLGYSMAGFRELLAVEWDKGAAELFRRNFPEVPVHEGDIADVDPGAVELPPGGLDVLDGSPPCQGFSTSGARRLTDTRNSLFREYARLLDAWAPRAFVMENVSGMVKGRMRPVFVDALRSLQDAGPGYRVKVQLLDAAWFRVPQTRQRVIFIGLRRDLAAQPVHPRPTARPVTVRDAWSDLDDPGEIQPITAPSVARLVPLIPPGRRGADVLIKAGLAPHHWDTRRLRWDIPACTICKEESRRIIHPAENRRAGARELTRLQSFPDEYDWGDSTPLQVQSGVGNSVPPLLMRAIASCVRGQLGRVDDEGGRHGQVRTAS
jgi:DNA (cytosine-5)-methyltransferase 1